ncbi:unnamed protein product [Clavelina lepadiformis]|uniref:Zinc ribbon domain-containing protein n=1 Tax=Clavelina lepadiformis TaxID=159417 RepID=A0ABP0F4R2_CLALP
MICTMYCTNCGKVLSSTHLFCGFCGQDTHSLKRKSDVMSFGQYKAVKGSQCKERVTKKSKPNESERAVDANYVASLLIPNDTDENSSKRIVEEKIMDNFVDFLMHLEDNKVHVTGHEILANAKSS